MIYDKREFNDGVPATAPDEIVGFRAYNNSQKPMRPEKIHAVWVREDGSRWCLSELVVFGTVIKKDGTVGQAPQEAHFYRYGRHVQDIPAWLSTAIKAAQPS